MKTTTSSNPRKNRSYCLSGAPIFSAMSLFLLVLLSGCANPVGVHRISPQESYQLNTVNPMGTDELSNSSMAVLHRYNLQDTFAVDLAKTTEHLCDLVKVDDRRDLLFTIAEVSYLHGTQLRKKDNGDSRFVAQDAFLQSAVYAYLYLLGEGSESLPSAYDIRFRMACDLYNRALWLALPENPDHSLKISGGMRKLPGGGKLQISLNTKNLGWDLEKITGIFPADSYEVYGFSVRNRTPGLGLPLIGKTLVTKESPNGGTLPITAFLRIPATFNGVMEETTAVELEFYSAFETANLEVNGRQVPLETDTTTPLAYVLNTTDLWNIGVKRFLFGAKVNKRILMVQPYKPGRIPVVFVHGTASSPVWWAEMLNTLRADPIIRQRFQFWFYQYNTSNMIVFSAAQMRDSLIEAVHQFDPQSQDSALQNMVVIGHSQGGLLTKMTAIDTGDVLFNSISDKNLDQMGLSAEDQNSIRRLLFFKPLPFVKRVVFISTPHRGSFLTKDWVRNLMRRLISIPVNILTFNTDDLTKVISTMKLPVDMRNRVPTSLDGMSADNPILQALVGIPLAPGVVGHSIISVKPGMAIETGDDGVVAYSSAHLEGMESEFVVRSGHSCQENSFTIEEVRRILLKHLGIASDRRILESAQGQ